MLDERIEYFLRELGNLPNAPYLPYAIATRLSELLAEIEGAFPGRLEITRNYLGVFARVLSPVENGLPILVSAHLDHPLFITRSRGDAIPFGLISTKQIDESLDRNEWEIPVNLWTSRGELVGRAQLIKTAQQKYPVVKAGFPVPKNCHVMWDLPLRIDNEFISLIAADNLLNCAISLAAIERILKSNENDLNITFMFGTIEEVKQLSATGVIQEGLPNGNKLGHDWLIFVLEVGPITLRPHLEKARSKHNLPEPKEYGGPALRVSDDYMLHGQQVKGSNLAEHVLLESRKHIDIPFQHSVSGGMCDASVFTSFGVSANIAGIALVNKYRHNIAEDAFPVYEQVRIRDINDGVAWLVNSLLYAKRYSETFSESSSLLTTVLEGTELEASEKVIARINIDRISTYIAMRPRMRRGYYFPETLNDRLKFWYAIGRAILFRFYQSRMNMIWRKVK